jgi:hypothetical protein
MRPADPVKIKLLTKYGVYTCYLIVSDYKTSWW